MHQQIARAPFQQDRDFQHAVLHHRVSKGQRQEKERHDDEDVSPKRNISYRQVSGAERSEKNQRGQKSGDRPPDDDPGLAAHLDGGRTQTVPDQRDEAEGV